MVEVRRQGVEALAGKAIDDRLDMVVEAPPFLDDDDAWARRVTVGHIGLELAAIRALQRDHLSHGKLLYLRQTIGLISVVRQTHRIATAQARPGDWRAPALRAAGSCR